MRADARLRSSRDIQRTLREGRPVAGRGVVVYYAPRTDGGSRVGFVVGRRIGGAVTRNRVKRLLREATAGLIPRLHRPVDMVIIARQPLVGARLADVERILRECVAQAGLIDDPHS